MSQAQIKDLAKETVSATLWTEAERAVIDLIDTLVKRLEVSDEVFAAAKAHLDDAELLEITHLVGLYTGVAMLVALIRPLYDQYQNS